MKSQSPTIAPRSEYRKQIRLLHASAESQLQAVKRECALGARIQLTEALAKAFAIGVAYEQQRAQLQKGQG